MSTEPVDDGTPVGWLESAPDGVPISVIRLGSVYIRPMYAVLYDVPVTDMMFLTDDGYLDDSNGKVAWASPGRWPHDDGTLQDDGPPLAETDD